MVEDTGVRSLRAQGQRARKAEAEGSVTPSTLQLHLHTRAAEESFASRLACLMEASGASGGAEEGL